MIEIPKNLDTILHIGAGEGEELPTYLASNAKRIILVEPNPKLAKALRQESTQDERVQVLELAITDDTELNQLTEYNLPEAASLYRPTGLRDLYPGLRVIAEHPVTTWAPEKLLEEYPLHGDQNLLVVQAPGAELAILKPLTKAKQIDAVSHIWLSCPREAHYANSGRADDVLAELERAIYQIKAEHHSQSDWPQWHLVWNPVARKAQDLELEKQALTEALENSKSSLDTVKFELSEARKQFDHEQQARQTQKQELSTRLEKVQAQQAELEQQLNQAHESKKAVEQKSKDQDQKLEQQKQVNAELTQQRDQLGKQAEDLKTERDQARQQLEITKAELKQAQDAKQQQQKTREQAEKCVEDLAKKVKQLEQQLSEAQAGQKQINELKQRIEYLFDQQGLQLEQAANALGRHVSSTAQSTAIELQAGVALQQHFGGDMPSLESGNTRLPSTVALALSRQLKTQPYDLIVELGSGVTTTFMAHTLRDHKGKRFNDEERDVMQVSRYIDPSEDDLPKRIVSFEHNRSSYSQRLEALKASGLSPLIGLQFAPLVPYNYQGQEYLSYDCSNRLQQVSKLFEGRQARIFVLVNQPVGDSQPELLVVLPQVLQHLSAHTLDLVVNNQGRAELTRQWQSLLDERGIEYQQAKAFGTSHFQWITINP